jgi:uncharacterized membrane protein YccC
LLFAISFELRGENDLGSPGSFLRIAGTIVGAIVGVWLASDYASTPAIFLAVFFLVMVLAGYNFGHVGARQVPYAHFLLGLTTLAIVTEGVTNPGQAWQTGLDRTEEIVIFASRRQW